MPGLVGLLSAQEHLIDPTLESNSGKKSNGMGLSKAERRVTTLHTCRRNSFPACITRATQRSAERRYPRKIQEALMANNRNCRNHFFFISPKKQMGKGAAKNLDAETLSAEISARAVATTDPACITNLGAQCPQPKPPER